MSSRVTSSPDVRVTPSSPTMPQFAPFGEIGADRSGGSERDVAPVHGPVRSRAGGGPRAGGRGGAPPGQRDG